MKKILFLLCLSAIFFACKKNRKDIQPPPTVGAITGNIPLPIPVTVIYATDDHGNTFSGPIDPGTGKFKIDSLPAGKYLLSLVIDMNTFLAGDLSVDVQTGKTSESGTLRIDQRFAKFTVDRVPIFQIFFACSFNNGKLMLSITSFSLGGTISGANYKVLDFSIGQIIKPGQYQLDGVNSTMKYSEYNKTFSGEIKSLKNWMISSTAPEGLVEITEIDPVARTIKGKFNGTVIRGSSVISSRLISGGEFYLHY